MAGEGDDLLTWLKAKKNSRPVGPRKAESSCMAVATGGLATWSSSLHGVVASMAGNMGMQEGGLSVYEPRRNAHVAVHAREKDMPMA